MIKKVLFFCLFIPFISHSQHAQNEAKPNVIIIYSDDVGYGDVGVYGAEKINTPNLDKLASEGIKFTDAHSSSATCTPSRYSLLTGQYAFRKKGTGILQGDAALCISTERTTLPKIFKQAGYTTGAVGKWHLGLGNGETTLDWNTKISPGPLEIGFDYAFLLPSTGDRVPSVYMENHYILNLDPKDPLYVSYKSNIGTDYPNGIDNPEAQTLYKSDGNQHAKTVINGVSRIGYMSGGHSAVWNDEEMADELVKRSKSFIEQNKKKPFFLYLATHDIHVPRIPNKRFRGKSEHGYRGDAMVQLDWCVGEIMAYLEKENLKDNTILIFTSDNGPVYNDGYFDGSTVKKATKPCDNGHCASGPFQGGKYSPFEGGTRVPMVISWPNKIAKGIESKALIGQTDFLASFANLLNVQLPNEDYFDSKNMILTLLGDDLLGAPFLVEQSSGLGLRLGDWKYISERKANKRRNRPAESAQLYNLSEDIGETTNILKNHPEIAQKMALMLEKIKNKNLK